MYFTKIEFGKNMIKKKKKNEFFESIWRRITRDVVITPLARTSARAA